MTRRETNSERERVSDVKQIGHYSIEQEACLIRKHHTEWLRLCTGAGYMSDIRVGSTS